VKIEEKSDELYFRVCCSLFDPLALLFDRWRHTGSSRFLACNGLLFGFGIFTFCWALGFILLIILSWGLRFSIIFFRLLLHFFVLGRSATFSIFWRLIWFFGNWSRRCSLWIGFWIRVFRFDDLLFVLDFFRFLLDLGLICFGSLFLCGFLLLIYGFIRIHFTNLLCFLGFFIFLLSLQCFRQFSGSCFFLLSFSSLFTSGCFSFFHFSHFRGQLKLLLFSLLMLFHILMGSSQVQLFTVDDELHHGRLVLLSELVSTIPLVWTFNIVILISNSFQMR